MATTKTTKRPARKKISRKKSLKRSEFYDQVNAYLAETYGWDETMRRAYAREVTDAVVQTAIANAVTEKGCMIPGLGRLTFRFRKARKEGTMINRFTNEEVEVSARPAAWIPKFRLVKAARDAMATLAPKLA